MGLREFGKVAELSEPDFRYFSETIRSRTGIHLNSSKKELLRCRLNPRLLELGLKSVSEYQRLLVGLHEDHEEWQNLVNLITTNKTDFFRERDHFEFLTRELLPKWKGHSAAKPLTIWSAACSTGEEPYTLAMVLSHYFGDTDSFRILATDVDTEALAFAKNGVYPKTQLAQIPTEYRSGSVRMGTGEISGFGKMSENIRRSIQFKPCNLISHPFPWNERFDLILCRNVFIYFQPEVIASVVGAMQECASRSGYLFIGHTESLQGIQSPWKYVKPSVFTL